MIEATRKLNAIIDANINLDVERDEHSGTFIYDDSQEGHESFFGGPRPVFHADSDHKAVQWLESLGY